MPGRRSETPGKDSAALMTDTISPRPAAPRRPHTADEAAVWYADALGWPVTPGLDPTRDQARDAGQDAGRDAGCCGEGLCDQDPHATAPAAGVAGAGPWRWAASSAPSLVRAVWRLSPGAPVLAVLGRPVPGALRLGVVDVPALVGVAALERLGKNPAAAGPITDGQGRIRFLVDLGEDDEPEYGLGKWRDAGVDVRVCGRGRYCPLPTPGAVGPSWVVWAIPPDPDRRTLPHARQVTAVLDRAVRDAYPALWDVVTQHP
jgi:hypothetical protein